MKYLKTIGYGLLVILTSFLASSTYAQENCEVSSVTFSQITPTINIFTEGQTSLTINTSGDCSEGVGLRLMAVSDQNIATTSHINNLPTKFYPSTENNKIKISLGTGTAPCYGNNEGVWGFDCVTFVEITNSNNTILYTGNTPQLTPQNIVSKNLNGILIGNCTGNLCGTGGTNNDYNNWDYLEIIEGYTPYEDNCVLSNNGNLPDVWFTAVDYNTSEQNLRGKKVKLNIKTAGNCDNIPLKIQLIRPNLDPVPDLPVDIIAGTGDEFITLTAPTGQNLEVIYEIGEDSCFTSITHPDCMIAVKIFKNNNKIFSSGNFLLNRSFNNDFYSNINYSKGVLVFNCIGTFCEATDNEWTVISTNGTNGQEGSCIINDVKFQNVGNIIDGQLPVLTIDTSNCRDQAIKLMLYEEDTIGGDDKIDIVWETNTDDVIDIFPNEDEVIISFKSTDNECDKITTDSSDCRIYVNIQTSAQIFNSEPQLDGYNDSWTTDNSYLDKGLIFSNCEGSVCGTPVNLGYSVYDPWEIINISGIDNSFNPVDIGLAEPTYDEDSPCFISYAEGYEEDCYELLAPIAGIGDKEKGGRVAISNIKDYKLSEYVNTMFQVALGVLMVLSVIMIVVAGVEYMTVESIYGKSKAKSHITGALTGLILGLGIFLILKTINPKLLNVDFGSGIQVAKIVAENDYAIQQSIQGDSNYPAYPSNLDDGTYTTNQCPEGIIKVENTYVCSSVQTELTNLFTTARSAGQELSGGGFRTREQQEYLYNKHNCPDCTIPTAPPGSSMHESGLAIDFNCTVGNQTGAINVHEGNTNGVPKPWTQDCYDWMKTNAGGFGFKNLKYDNGNSKENWHWSTNGK